MRTIATTLALAVLLAAAATSSASAATIAASPAGSVSAVGSPYDISTTAGDISYRLVQWHARGLDTGLGRLLLGDFSSGSLSRCTTTGSVLGPIVILFAVIPVVTVQQILGTPPAITGIQVTRSNVQISFNVLGVTCLYRGNVNYLAPFVTLRTTGDRAIGTFTALPGQTLPLIFGTAPPCPRVASVAGTTWLYGTLQRVNII